MRDPSPLVTNRSALVDRRGSAGDRRQVIVRVDYTLVPHGESSRAPGPIVAFSALHVDQCWRRRSFNDAAAAELVQRPESAVYLQRPQAVDGRNGSAVRPLNDVG